MRTLPVDEGKPVYDIIHVFKALFKQRESDSTQTILSKLRNIFGSKAVSEVFTYLCQHGATPGWEIQRVLDMSEANTYRAIKQLRTLGFIVPALKVGKVTHSKGGPRPTVWALEGASPNEVADALRLHYRMLSPKYRIAETVAQTILEEYQEKGRPMEVRYSEIIIHVKKLKIPFTTPDIADLAAQYLHEKGIKVWR